MNKNIRKKGPWRDVWRRLRKNKLAMFGLIVLILLSFCAIFANHIAPEGYDDQNLSRRFSFPNKENLLGTDNFGRDILSRMIYGSRVSLTVGFIAVGMAVVIGGGLGAVAAFYGNKVDNIIMRAMDILLAIPGMLLALSLAAALGPGLNNMMIAIGVGNIPSYARVVRASVLTVKEQEYVEAARSIGASDFRIIFGHIIPNAMAPIIVQATLGVAGAILSAAALSFLGLGIQPPYPEWGAMLSGARQYIRDYWYMTTFPGLMIMITIYCLNVLGDGLRDALDPRLKN
ncbi:ABC transporter permease [Maledivibacter halophilus]|uniref:Peptide/nickel transport system permease protein n=1 Tax=Maledivibacter halophilus TaxID=36842 RepID=A0A1T5IBW8_9FIRM|nr:ABC transporter permease [Maledivibacter halophilus]SKC36691.1 peptide/nickel transport system permease protein [Maledivibacter halophilus]